MEKCLKDALRKKWYDMRKNGEVDFESMDDFYQWAEENDFTGCERLERIDVTKPYSRENCQWRKNYSRSSDIIHKEMAEKWERGVGLIRKKLRPQIDAQLRKQAIEAEKNRRVVWRYPHPDLVREGIVWAGS